MLMNWIVSAARTAGHEVQATSVPGVAQRTGSTSYYIEVGARSKAPQSVLSLMPMPARVDVVLSSELVETARVIAAGFVSPDRTTLVSSTTRVLSTAEKINLGDGRYSTENIRTAAEKMSRQHFLLDLGQLAADNGTFVSATMFGALAGSGTLPWPNEISRSVLTDDRSKAGFDAALAAVEAIRSGSDPVKADKPAPKPIHQPAEIDGLPNGLRDVVALGFARTTDYQDAAYGQSYLERTASLIEAADLSDHRSRHAVTEACRRLALWMAYEDIARVADLKSRPERFQRIRDEVQLEPGQTITVTEYMKPRAEEVADILPAKAGAWVMRRALRGGWFPLLGRGIHIRSNGVLGYRVLRLAGLLRRIRRRSYRFRHEQAVIEDWLTAMQSALPRSSEFAAALAELPRLLKGYSDTLMRGKAAYRRIVSSVVQPAIATGTEADNAATLRATIGAALADDTHEKLDAALSGRAHEPAVPNLRSPANA